LTRSNQEKSFEDVGNPTRTVFRVGLFHRHHSLLDFGGHPGVAASSWLNFQPLDPPLTIQFDPSADGGSADAELFGKQRRAVLFFQEQPYDL
jgi:hypothetical protein